MLRSDSFLQALVLALSVSFPSVAAAAEVPWPNSAEGRALPRPQWILAVPARRGTDGSLKIWDRTDEWTKDWRVPKTIDGLRVVTLLGDSEDRRAITPEAIDEMLVDQMQPVMKKYGAPALALIVTDGTATAVAGYVPGWPASWETVPDAATLSDSHDRAIETIDGMFRSAAMRPRDEQQTAEASVRILAYRADPATGGTDYRLHISAEMADTALNGLSTMPGTTVVSTSPQADGSSIIEISRAPNTPSIESDLQAYGLLR